jgi:hypothetical protein
VATQNSYSCAAAHSARHWGSLPEMCESLKSDAAGKLTTGTAKSYCKASRTDTAAFGTRLSVQGSLSIPSIICYACTMRCSRAQ